MSHQSRILSMCLMGILLSVLPFSSSWAQQLAKRLILKDGSYQLITRYEVHGDRVHYFSAERNSWEDVPNSLVDWDATAKFEKDRAAGAPPPEAIQLDHELAEERKAEEMQSPQIAPGLRLPEDGEVFLLDSFHAQPQLIELLQNDAEVDRDTKRNVLRAAINPVAGSKMTFELPGLHSKIQSHVASPSIYVNVRRLPQFEDAPKPANGASTSERSEKKKNAEPWDPLQIVRLQLRKDERIIANIHVAVYGKVNEQEVFVPAKTQQLTGGWKKITPSSELTEGEYALIEKNEHGDIIAAVWDFGINPSAPANVAARVPEQKAQENTEHSKELHSRKPE